MERLTTASATVSEALTTRFSCREFLDREVSEADIKYIVETATRAPSGGNLQPWHIWVLQGDALRDLVADIQAKMVDKPMGEGSEYHIYPPDLQEPYESRRREIGRLMFDVIGLSREDKMGRAMQMARNFDFFGAPIGMFFALEKNMQEGQWSDMGMLIQSIMLLARSRGLHTCPQEAWAIWSPSVKARLGIGDNMTLFCGLALGYADPDAAVNKLESPRAPMEQIVHYIGF